MSESSEPQSTFPPATVRPILASIAVLLKERNQTVAVVESSAGGLISAYLLSVPGASAYYRGGLTLYSLESRIAYAGWTEDMVKDYAGPTPENVADLALRIQTQLTSTYVICESGIAGPTNGRGNTPAGFAALAVAGPLTELGASTSITRTLTGKSDREYNMLAFAEAALKFFLQVLNENA